MRSCTAPLWTVNSCCALDGHHGKASRFSWPSRNWRWKGGRFAVNRKIEKLGKVEHPKKQSRRISSFVRKEFADILEFLNKRLGAEPDSIDGLNAFVLCR